MKICEVCEKSVETVFVSAYGEWLVCKPCLISERFAIMREEGEFASQADYPQGSQTYADFGIKNRRPPVDNFVIILLHQHRVKPL